MEELKKMFFVDVAGVTR